MRACVFRQRQGPGQRQRTRPARRSPLRQSERGRPKNSQSARHESNGEGRHPAVANDIDQKSLADPVKPSEEKAEPRQPTKTPTASWRGAVQLP